MGAEPRPSAMRDYNERKLAPNNLAVLHTEDDSIFDLHFLRWLGTRIPNRAGQAWSSSLGGHIEEPNASSFSQRGCEAKCCSKHEARSKHCYLPRTEFQSSACRWMGNVANLSHFQP